MMRTTLLSVLLLFFTACSYLPGELTQNDIDMYQRAYENLAKVSSELDAEEKKSGSSSVFTCTKCQEIMREAVVEAGYQDLKSFLFMDLRISYTMRYVLYLQIAELLGGSAEEVPAERICSDKQEREKPDTNNDSIIDTNCAYIHGFSAYIEKIGGLINRVAKKLISKGDLKLVGDNFDSLLLSVTDERLVDELNRSKYSGDDWDD